MSYQRLFAALLLMVWLMKADLLASEWGQSSCGSNGNYSSNSAYSSNLNTTLSSLPTNIDNYGFYNASTGQGADTANAIALCRPDTQPDECRDCVKKACADLVDACPVQKEGLFLEVLCTIRYSNDTIYGSLGSLDVYNSWYYVENVTSPKEFKEDLRRLLGDLRRRAAAGTSRMKVAAGNASGPDYQTIYGLVQCSPDLSSEDCTSCLIGAISYLPECCEGSIGASVLLPSCNLRFETTLFFNQTRLHELEFVPPQPSPPPGKKDDSTTQTIAGKKDDSTTQTIVIVVVAIVVLLIVIISAIFFLRKRKKQKPKEIPQLADDISIVESLQYDFSTIKAATNDFADDNKLGQGGFGTVYKGALPNGQEIAVKRLSRYSGQGDIEFKNEVLLLAKLQHRNLVRLLGFSLEGKEKLLVYEFVQNASLDSFIFVKHSDLDWDRRYKIIGGIARGILYLHEDSRLRIIHRDLKASNILLDKEMSPKIADFGMARLLGLDETHGNTSRVVGTYFGVLVLEIISAQKNSNGFRHGDDSVGDLMSFAWDSWKEGRGEDVVDPFLRSDLGSMKEMMRCINIGLLCVQENAADRPTMASVVLMLSSFFVTLNLPSKPAFYASDASLIHNFDSVNSYYSRPSQQSHLSSQNNASITDLHPR
ncbi:cysteine-rich receptor-like protein kinase 26 isoform X2 [Salvia hispanica]|uniref:cysteine-rich receptor-like protein kinase 26 isoform X2 n=1 Tax=Salvia hispanica TaxID=49212 RepID=UPI002009C1C3|nr:cysteine-rich receptor-like protein kinase 26 isoform X2 [Salvia hispanica]